MVKTIDRIDEFKTKEKLLRELDEIRAQLTANARVCRAQVQGLNRIRSLQAQQSSSGPEACISRDITERKKAEEALNQSEEKFRKIYESSIVGIFQSVPSGRFIDVNPAFAAMLGYDSPQDLLSCISDIETQFYRYPEDRARYRRMIEQNGYVENIEYDVKGKDGSIVCVNNSSRAHTGPDGAIVRYEGIVVDITERKKAEEALRESETLLKFAGQLALVGGWSLKLSEKRVKWSDAVTAIHEVEKGFLPTVEETLGFYAPEYRQKITEVFTACVQEGVPYDVEMQIITAGGKRVWVRTIGVAERDEDSKITAVKGAFQDISERRRSEEALRQLNKALKQRNELAEARARQLQNLTVELIEAEERERRQFAQFLHDDLQQMIASAKMQVQAVADGLPPNPLLLNAAQLLEESIAKSRSLSHELSPAVLHQCGLVAALRWLTGQVDEQFGLKVDLETNTDLLLESSPFTIFLFRAVQELLFNIVKHAGVKSGRVLLASSNGSLEIKVRDQGQGFDPQIMNNPSDKVGFGLMTIRERARYMGGQLSVQSAPGKGSCFTLTVPIHQAAASRQAKTEDRPTLAPCQPKMKAGCEVVRVLFADDHKLMRQGLIRLIANHPNILLVGEASNGREALEQTRRQKPDVVVMDVSMPEMDGIEATRHITAELPDVRVIGLSMHSDAHIAQTMREAGATAFLSKTTSSAELLNTIYEAAFDDQEARRASSGKDKK